MVPSSFSTMSPTVPAGDEAASSCVLPAVNGPNVQLKAVAAVDELALFASSSAYVTVVPTLTAELVVSKDTNSTSGSAMVTNVEDTTTSCSDEKFSRAATAREVPATLPGVFRTPTSTARVRKSLVLSTVSLLLTTAPSANDTAEPDASDATSVDGSLDTSALTFHDCTTRAPAPTTHQLSSSSPSSTSMATSTCVVPSMRSTVAVKFSVSPMVA